MSTSPLARTTSSYTPREIVGELDRYIVGQAKAKRAVALALRNRWRRQQVAPELRDEIAPKNIIMIGPTGVGKTEIARRLAKLAAAPFIKVEASKFTEVGYVGRDVDSIVRDLVELAITMVRTEEMQNVRARAQEHAEDRLLAILAGKAMPQQPPPGVPSPRTPFGFTMEPRNTFDESQPAVPTATPEERERLREDFRAGRLDDRHVEIDVSEQSPQFLQIFSGQGLEEMGVNMQDLMGHLPGFKGKTRRRKVRVPDAFHVLAEEEAAKLVDMDRVQRDAVERTEQSGIVFLDEIDKIAGRERSTGPDVSREGVQRDLLPIVEGSTVSTKYGSIKTDHILFIAAGAFHVSKVSDLIPELQGRFPVRVELDALKKDDLVRILREPKNALTSQYRALLATEGVELQFTDDAVEAIADVAATINARAENIGARRLHTVMEALLEDISFTAPEAVDLKVTIDGAAVHAKLSGILKDEDLSRYIL
ncbi:MAG: ATP-dependent protease ATPase subunit HslU [Deltaproteobacteria bacterium]|nr:ATP-dependent protease ATPase subunit HslU [Deltaproteobacteria bacterium]